MKNYTIALVLGGGLLACASIAAAQDVQTSAQTPQFETSIIVTATPKMDTALKGSLSDYFLTFSGPVGVPGATLAAGTYLFRFPYGRGEGTIQILKADKSNIYALFMTIPVVDLKRSLVSDAQVVMWQERQSGLPPMIKGWYLPGETRGFEFVYPKKPA